MSIENLELINKIREVSILGTDFKLYNHAQIEFREFDPEEVNPIANYVLVGNLIRLTEIRMDLLSEDIDIFQLKGLIDKEKFAISPPIIEWSEEDNLPVIVDGIHRFWLAKHLGKKIRSIFIRQVDPNYPVISYPLEWSEVAVCEKRPNITRQLRKNIVDTHKFYRDFSILGSTGRRATTLV